MVVKVKLLFFAQARELAGKSADSLIVPESITCCNLLKTIVERYSLEKIENSIVLSVNEQLYHVEDNLSLKEDDEVAVIPPLSGG